ncbi:MAG: cytoplasmic protein, partial [Cyanobacteria bacterium]|nr:cytoplasmic protein [Cyanobacteria bacterium CG_2015-02_32_10]
MTTLAKDQSRDFQQGEINDTPVIATDIIYEGAAVGDNGSGYARPLVAGDPFLGFAACK